MKKSILLFAVTVCAVLPLFAASVSIESPRGGFTTKRVQEIKGHVAGSPDQRAVLVINGIPVTLMLSGSGDFSLSAVVAPGNNMVELKCGDAADRISFFASVPPRDVKVVLTWDTTTDVDLWVVDPKGEKCYYAHRSTKSGGNLDVDITAGYGPETFTMAKALPGTYTVQTQYFSSNGAPITRVNIYVVLYEGTPRESRKAYQFVMTKEHQVYQIGQFAIDPE